MDGIDRLQEMLKEDLSTKLPDKKADKEKDTTVKLQSFDKLLSEIKKRFGKDSIISSEDNGVILTVKLCRLAFSEHQKEMEPLAKQEWVYDNGYALLSVQPEVEPEAVKLYFTSNLKMGKELSERNFLKKGGK